MHFAAARLQGRIPWRRSVVGDAGFITSGGTIMPFVQVGNRVFYGSTICDNSLVTVSTTPTLVTLNVPTGMPIIANYRLTLQNSTGSLMSYLVQSPSEPVAVPNTSTGLVTLQTGGSNTAAEISTLTSSSGQVRISSNITGGTFSTSTTGFTLQARGAQ